MWRSGAQGNGQLSQWGDGEKSENKVQPDLAEEGKKGRGRGRAAPEAHGMEAGRSTSEGQTPKLVLLFIYLKTEGRGLHTGFFCVAQAGLKVTIPTPASAS